MNKARLLKMYIDGAHVSEIAEECKCSTKTVYKIVAKHGVHRKKYVREKKQKVAPKPKKVMVEPMYREISTHINVGAVKEEKQRELIKELKRYRAEQEKKKPWYMK